MSQSDTEKRLEIVADLLKDIEEPCGVRGGSRDELETAMARIDHKATAARFVLAEVIEP